MMMMMLRGKSIIIAILLLIMCCWVCSASSRHLSSLQDVLVASSSSSLQGKTNQHPYPRKLDTKQRKENEACKELSTLGSRPPKCEHKCGGCIPCEAIQVPTTSDNVGVQYTNYMPEGWKCKCGASFFNP